MSDTDTQQASHDGRGQSGGELPGGIDFERLTANEVREIVEEGLSYLSAEDLTAIIDQASERLQGKREAARQGLIEKWRKEAAGAGVDFDSLFPHVQTGRRTRSDSGGVLPPKYKGPNGETWTGRGQPPRWLKVLMELGHKKEEFRIQEGEQLPLA